MDGARFKVGDRIKETFLGFERLRTGTITEVYQSTNNHVGQFYWMYAIKWSDTGYEQRGYLGLGWELVDD